MVFLQLIGIHELIITGPKNTSSNLVKKYDLVSIILLQFVKSELDFIHDPSFHRLLDCSLRQPQADSMEAGNNQ